MGIADRQLDATQAPLYQGLEELGPEQFRLGAADLLEKGHYGYGVILVAWSVILVIAALLQWSVAD